MTDAGTDGRSDEPTVGSLAQLYLGNILYALELSAHTLDGQGKPEDAAFYRGIARELAVAHGRSRPDGPAAPAGRD